MRTALVLWLAFASLAALTGSISISKEATDRIIQQHQKMLEKIVAAGEKLKVPHGKSGKAVEKIKTVHEVKSPIATVEDDIDTGINIINKKICTPGYTGTDCESVCDSTSPVYDHDGQADYGDTIDYVWSQGCDMALRLPLDQYINDLYIIVSSYADVSPRVSLYSPGRGQVPPTSVLLSSTRSHFVQFKDLGLDYGHGEYSTMVTTEIASGGAVCLYEVSAPTLLVFDGGFVRNKSDDFVQEILPGPNQGVGKYPIVNIPYWFGYKFPDVINYPAHPTEVVVYSVTTPEQVHDTENRYRCNAAAIAGPYTCTQVGEQYFIEIRGIDQDGYDFQRTYKFDCETATPPTTTVPPIPTECFNGGIMVNQNTECYCTAFYEGYQCEIKRCFNDGVLGSGGQCLCRLGYSGDSCQDVVCPRKSGAQFDLSSRALTFIVRSGTSMAAHMPKIIDAARRITDYYTRSHPNYFMKYVLAVVSNGVLLAHDEYDSAQQFINGLQAITHENDLICNDILLTALSAVLESPSVALYRQSPIFVFSDGLSNDDDEERIRLLHQLTFWRGQVFFMLTDSITGRCNIDMAAPGYRQLRVLAQFSHGLVSHVSLDLLGDTAVQLAQSLYHVNYLMTNDLLDSCNRAPTFQNFFIDENIQYFHVIATGTGLKLTLTRPDRTVIYPETSFNASENTYIWTISTSLERGSYLLTMNSTGVHPCQYRVIGRGDYDLFLGISQSISEDAKIQQPTYYNESHIVAHINNVILPTNDIASLHAEAVIWTNEGIYDKRTVLYASNGVYRDNCDFYLYFGAWKCTQQDQFFYVNVFITDNAGFTIQRTTTGFCSTIPPTPIPPEGCLNGGIGYNGTCICPAHYTGSKCENIECLNLGTPQTTHCGCIAGYTGQFCETPTCQQRNENPPFTFNGRSLTMLIHDSISTRSAIRSIRELAPRIIQDILHHHTQWIVHYHLVRFNDSSFSTEADSPNPEEFLNGINNIYQRNTQNSEISCKDLSLLPALWSTLNDYRITQYGFVYIFINGYMSIDYQLLSWIYEAIDTSHTRITVALLSGAPCGQPISDHIPTETLMSLSAFSDGEFTMVMPSNAGQVAHSIPTDYRSSYIYEDYGDDCSKGRIIYFPVDSQMQSFTVYILGDLDGAPVYYAPDGSQFTANIIWSDIGLGSRLDQVVKPCDDQWDIIDNRCWKFGILAKTWYDARAECHGAGSVLATIYNAVEQTFLDAQAGSVDYWTGLNDISNRGEFVWDQLDNITLSLNSTGYTNWATNQPDLSGDVNRCVFDKHKTTPGWSTADCSIRLPYICMKHAYDVDFEPDSLTVDILPRGIWKAFLKTYEGACNVQIYAQSGIQLFDEYVTNVHADSGESQPFIKAEDNRIIAHMTNQQTIGESIEGHLQYAHMYTMSIKKQIVQAQHFHRRNSDDCAYEYVSTGFKCPGYSFQKLSTGIDRFGYLYQRIEPVTCTSGPVNPEDCRNGGVLYQGKCVCAPRYEGIYCESPICVYGRLIATGTLCRCRADYFGTTCETPLCMRSGNISDPTPLNKTFVLLLDGAKNGDMVGIQDSIRNILTTVFKTTNFNELWFARYLSVIFRDSGAGADSLSDIIDTTVQEDFITAIEAELAAKQYVSQQQTRSVLSAMVKALKDADIAPRSYVFVITSSTPEDSDQLTLAFDEVAWKHLYVNFFIVNDEAPPLGVSNYTDPAMLPYFNLAYASGGGYYQGTKDPEIFAYNIRDMVYTLYTSYHISAASRTNFTGLTEYIQIGANTSVLYLDIFSDTNPNVTIIDADGNNVTVYWSFVTKTNRILSGPAVGEPGLWTVTIIPSTMVDGGGFCYIAARGRSNVRVNIAFTHDLRDDKGWHSDSAEYYPIAGANENAIVADTNSGVLTFVQAFSSDERRLLWSSPLIERYGCTYTYVSANLFTCAETSVAIAVDGEDWAGHPIRRMIHVHCIGNIGPTIAPRNTTTVPTTSPQSTLPPPTCSPVIPIADVVIAFDVSLGVTMDEFVQVVTAMHEILDLVSIGPPNTRFMIGTYWDQAEFVLTPTFDTIKSQTDFYPTLNYLSLYGYQGEMGNNIQSVFNAINPTSFRQEATKLMIIFSSMGWDKSNSEQGFPDPTGSANSFRAQGITIVPIGYGPNANMTQLTAIGGSCARSALNKYEIEELLPWITHLVCRSDQLC